MRISDNTIVPFIPENTPSRRTCEKIGAKLLEIVDLPVHNQMYLEGERRKCIYEWKLV